MGQKVDAMQANMLTVMKSLEDLTMAVVRGSKNRGKGGEEQFSHSACDLGENGNRKEEGWNRFREQGKEVNSRQYQKNLRLDFPRFNGQDHRGWLRKCHKFFKYHMVEEEERVELATMHFDGAAELWYQNFEEELGRLRWEAFGQEVVMRFNVQPYENIEGEFSKLMQTTTVADYQEKFEELRAIIKAENPGLSEKFYINSFISGLKKEIRYQVHMFFPTTLTQAFSIARIPREQPEVPAKT